MERKLLTGSIVELLRLFGILSLLLWVVPSSALAASSVYRCGSDCAETLAESQRIVAQLEANSDQIVGIEMILAAPSTEHVYNRWGHALLRFVMAGNNPVYDNVLEFVAMVPNQDPNLAKGLFGGYPAAAQFEPLQEFWEEYVSEEDRDLIRSIIPTSPQMRMKLLRTLETWISDPAAHIRNYDFVNNNCAGMMTRFLQEAGFPYSGIRARIPDHVPRYLRRLLLNPYPDLVVANPSQLFEKSAALLNLSQDDFLAGKNWPEDAASELLQSLSKLEIQRLLEYLPAMPPQARSGLRQKVGFVTGLGLEEVLGIQSVPAPLYQLCADSACVDKILPLEKLLWNDTQLAEAKKERAKTARKTLKHPKNSILAAPDVVTHFELLLQADQAEGS